MSKKKYVENQKFCCLNKSGPPDNFLQYNKVKVAFSFDTMSVYCTVNKRSYTVYFVHLIVFTEH